MAKHEDLYSMLRVIHNDEVLDGEDSPLIVFIRETDLAKTLEEMRLNAIQCPDQSRYGDPYGVFGMFPKDWTTQDKDKYIRNALLLLSGQEVKKMKICRDDTVGAIDCKKKEGGD